MLAPLKDSGGSSHRQALRCCWQGGPFGIIHGNLGTEWTCSLCSLTEASFNLPGLIPILILIRQAEAFSQVERSSTGQKVAQ